MKLAIAEREMKKVGVYIGLIHYNFYFKYENNRSVNKLIFDKRVIAFLVFICWKLYHWTGFEDISIFFSHALSGINDEKEKK